MWSVLQKPMCSGSMKANEKDQPTRQLPRPKLCNGKVATGQIISQRRISQGETIFRAGCCQFLWMFFSCCRSRCYCLHVFRKSSTLLKRTGALVMDRAIPDNLSAVQNNDNNNNINITIKAKFNNLAVEVRWPQQITATHTSSSWHITEKSSPWMGYLMIQWRQSMICQWN